MIPQVFSGFEARTAGGSLYPLCCQSLDVVSGKAHSDGATVDILDDGVLLETVEIQDLSHVPWNTNLALWNTSLNLPHVSQTLSRSLNCVIFEACLEILVSHRNN